MATEVSCGQCQGRLLVETLGVVVACPHCGTHLSIPAPEPTPAPIPEPAPPAPPAAPEPPPVQYAPPPVAPQPEPTFVPTEVPAPVPQPVVTFASTPVEPPVTAPADDHHAVSVFAGVDEAAAAAQIGWHSTPNLHLSGEQPAIPDPAPQPPATYTAPLLEPFAPPSQPPVFDVTAAPAAPLAPAPMSAAMELQLSSTQQFSLGAAAPQAPAAAPFPTTFAPAPQVPAPAPASNPASFSFGAGPATAPTSAPQPFSFGAGPAPSAPAPVSYGNAAAAPMTFDSPAVDVGATTRSAAEAAALVDEEFAQRQKFQFMLLVAIGSYASCVTLVLLYMLIRGQASNLESLPDLVPPRGENGQVKKVYNPPKNSVAPGHVLTLGQTRRFGNVNVTPLKVTRGPVKFEHLFAQPGATREPTPPLLKLWVKFENVSRNQTFTPLDPYLLFSGKSSALSGPIHANSFVATVENQRKGDPISLIYEMSKESEFRMVGQNLSIDLEPGEKLETFIPAEEDATELTGDMVWRFQFRKGYNPRSKRGVTTLIDVRFNSQDIKSDRG